MPHALATRMSHIWYHATRHEECQRVTIASFFVDDPEMALPPKMCPNQSPAFTEVKNSQALAVGKKKNAIIFCTSRFQVFLGMFVQSFAQIFEELTA